MVESRELKADSAASKHQGARLRATRWLRSGPSLGHVLSPSQEQGHHAALAFLEHKEDRHQQQHSLPWPPSHSCWGARMAAPQTREYSTCLGGLQFSREITEPLHQGWRRSTSLSPLWGIQCPHVHMGAATAFPLAALTPLTHPTVLKKEGVPGTEPKSSHHCWVNPAAQFWKNLQPRTPIGSPLPNHPQTQLQTLPRFTV